MGAALLKKPEVVKEVKILFKFKLMFYVIK
jgi:hypothetical protein